MSVWIVDSGVGDDRFARSPAPTLHTDVSSMPDTLHSGTNRGSQDISTGRRSDPYPFGKNSSRGRGKKPQKQ